MARVLGSTREQAMGELGRLCEANDRTLDDLTPIQTREWTDAMMALDYEMVRATMTQLIRVWGSSRFPPVGAFNRVYREVTQEGRPNAGAYSQSKRRELTDRERRQQRTAWEQQERWIEMDEAEYFDEVQRLRSSGAIRITGG